jgi:glycosyltransferase involved in cell wall biosynthesis
MKIGYITSPLTIGGGWALYAKGLIKAVGSLEGNEVIALAPIDSVGQFEAPIKLYPVLPLKTTFGPYQQWLIFRATMKYLKGCEVIHITYERPMIGAALAARFLGARLVMTLHGTYALPPKGGSLKKIIKRELMRFAYKTAAITTTGSFNTAERVREIIPELPECRFIPNGYDDAVFKRYPEIGVTDTILSVGWLKARKGFDIVIDALGKIKDQYPNLQYQIIGGDDDKPTDEYYQLLENKITQNGLEGRVHIRVGKITREDIAKEYNKSLMFVLVSRDDGNHFEGFPLVYFEALSCGSPVITTRGYGSEYAIKDGVHGFLVTQEDVPGTAEAIGKIAADRSFRDQLSANGLARAKEHTWNVIAPQLMQLYQDAKNIKK